MGPSKAKVGKRLMGPRGDELEEGSDTEEENAQLGVLEETVKVLSEQRAKRRKEKEEANARTWIEPCWHGAACPWHRQNRFVFHHEPEAPPEAAKKHEAPEIGTLHQEMFRLKSKLEDTSDEVKEIRGNTTRRWTS